MLRRRPSERCAAAAQLLLLVLSVALLPLETNATPMPFTNISKEELCSRDFDDYNAALRLMSVTPEQRSADTDEKRYPRVLCFINTISVHLKSRSQAVADTWGQRCDKLVFFSNETDVITVAMGTPREKSYDVIKMKAPADYHHLWLKHKESLQYVYKHYRHDYDWFYKADDDAYVVVDNLRAYLRRPQIAMNHRRQPMQMGKRFNLTADTGNYFITNSRLKQDWWKKWDRWVFNSCGPGYVMNRLFLDKFVHSIPLTKCFIHQSMEMLPDDTAISYCMMWHDVVPWDTRDTRGRDRWHADNPGGAYVTDLTVASDFWRNYHNGIGGLKWGDDCCAPDSIGYHYVTARGMHHKERMLYFCRTNESVPDLATFNDLHGLAIPDEILTVD